MTWYRSWYCRLKGKLFLSKELRWRFYLASSSLSLRPIQIKKNTSRPSMFQLYSPTKLFQNVGIICPNITYAIFTIFLLLITPPAWHVSIATSLTFFDQVVIQKIRSTYFFKNKIITSGLTFALPIIHWSSNKRKFWKSYKMYGKTKVT